MKETVYYVEPQTADNAALYVIDKSEKVKEYSVESYTKIGRICDDGTSNVLLNSSITSRDHGEIRYLDGQYYYQDLDSLNGTYINGTLYGKRANQKTCRLKNGDVLRIDQSNLNCCHSEAVVLLFIMKNGLQWKELILSEEIGNIEIGRDSSERQLLQFHDDSISRKHATFLSGAGGWSIIDHNSKNGVYVNNNRIENAVPIHRLDVIRIASTVFFFLGNKIIYNSDELKGGKLEIHIKERSVRKLFKKKILIQDIDLTINPCEMVLILGGSGAGKTTFMNAIMGYEKAEGTILHDDVDIYREYSRMKYKIGYVPQQDLLRDQDTVYYTLVNAAKMKMPSNTSAEELNKQVGYVLELLGLQRENRTLVKKLSGGQKKRLSIATEYIGNPSLFFLDEPDSGLDGVLTRSLMESLRVIANEGKIVIVITHNPDRVADLFDKVIVLAKGEDTNSGGQLAYYGSIPKARKFFDTDTLEGIVKKISRSDEAGEGLSDYYIGKYKTLNEKGD